METEVIKLVRAIAISEGVTEAQLLWGVLPIVDRRHMPYDTCHDEGEERAESCG